MIIGAIVWCLIPVSQPDVCDYCYVSTAARGRITKIEDKYFYVDFSKYANEQRYKGKYYDILVHEDECVKE